MNENDKYTQSQTKCHASRGRGTWLRSLLWSAGQDCLPCSWGVVVPEIDWGATEQKMEVLEATENKLVEAIEIAANVVEDIAVVGDAGEDRFEALAGSTESFLAVVQEIKMGMESSVNLVSDYRTFERSSYGLGMDAEVGQAKLRAVLAQLHSTNEYLDNSLLPKTKSVTE